MEYKLTDLSVIDNPIDVIKRNPDLYGGEPPRAPRIAASIIRDLIFLGYTPVRVEEFRDGWWLIISDKDWIGDHDEGRCVWNEFISIPSIGSKAIRSEIILNSLALGLIVIRNGNVEVKIDREVLDTEALQYAKELSKEKSRGFAIIFKMD